jgi:hypothetical protein
MAFIVLVVATLGGAEWTVSQKLLELDERSSKNEQILIMLKIEIEELKVDEKHQADKLQDIFDRVRHERP